MEAREPQNKKIKLLTAPIFGEFRKDEKCMAALKQAVLVLKEGFNRMNFILIKITESNARTSVSFSRATCNTSLHERESYVAHSIFGKGIYVLEKYVGTRMVPEDEVQRKALEMLLLFLSKDRDGLSPKDNEGNEINFNGREGEWAVILAEHLLTKLAVDNNCVMASYLLPPDTLQKSCAKTGDTSFGCEEGWHGSVDILMEDNLPVQLFQEQQDEPQDEPQDYERPVSSVEVNADQNQLLAQTTVFSFLQMKYNNHKLTHSLIPAIGISTKHLYINLYDCINDVYLKSDALKMFGELHGKGKKRLLPEIVVLIWLTLNYRYLCTGVTEEMKNCKADFHKQLDDMITSYSNKVKRPVHVSGAVEIDWSVECGKKSKPVFEKIGFIPSDNNLAFETDGLME